MLEWINNSPIMQLSLEQFTYATGLPADMYWQVVGGIIAVASSAPVLSSLSSLSSLGYLYM